MGGGAVAGDGLVRPLNAPPSRGLVPGVQPGVSSAIVIANYVIVFGPTGTPTGVFVYQPGTKPALGNPPVAWMTAASKDPYGNTLPATGIVSYDGIANFSQLLSGNLILGHATWNAFADITLSSSIQGALRLLSPALNPGDSRCDFQLLPSPTPGSETAAVNRISAWAPNLAGNTVETWNAVTVPAGMTGSIRVKMLAEAKFAVLDINVTITSTTLANTTYTGGALPAAAYYPTQMSSSGNRQYALSMNQTTATSANARLIIPAASGNLAIITPGFSVAGNACVVMGTVTYPLD